MKSGLTTFVAVLGRTSKEGACFFIGSGLAVAA